jgi:hypothetical protein
MSAHTSVAPADGSGMGHRDAPAAAHPAPEPDWILGSDGHWKPPPMVGDRPTRRPGVTTVVAAPTEAERTKVGPAVIFSVILVIAAISYLAYVAFGG